MQFSLFLHTIEISLFLIHMSVFQLEISVFQIDFSACSCREIHISLFMNRDISILNKYICIRWVKPKMDCLMYVSALGHLSLLSYKWWSAMAPGRFGPFSISEHFLLSLLNNFPTIRTLPHLIISNGHILPILPCYILAPPSFKTIFRECAQSTNATATKWILEVMVH